MSNGCQIELGMAVERITAEDMKAELKCVTHNQEGRQEVVVQLRLEGELCVFIRLHICL